MGDVTQTIKIKEVVDVRDALKGLDEIKKNLSSLSLGPGLESEFNKIYEKIERNAEKANKAMASGFKNKGDVKAFDDAMRQISNLYDDIITKVKVLNSTKQINLQVEDGDVKSLNQQITDLKNNLKTLRSAAEQSGRDLGKVLKASAKHNKGGASSWNAAVKAFEDGKIDETEKAIKKLESTIKAAQTRANGAPLTDEWQQKAEDVKAMREAFDDYKDAQKEVIDEDSKLVAKTKELSDIMDRGADVLAKTAEVGEEGAKAFKQTAKEQIDAANSTQRLNSELDQFKNKAAYFFGLSNAINLFKRAVRSAYDTVKDLDAVMTETAVVTNFDVGDMWSQLPEYTQRANELGVTIHDTYEAATLFYQQGLKTNEVMAISNETLKMARIAGLDAATASDRMTNALRGFNMELDKTSAQRVNDVYSKLAAITASNTDEISTAMTKVASLAHNANMEFETTAAFLAQIIESTRESAETAGTALKTVVARFSEVKKLYSKGQLMGNDEEGEVVDVNKVSTALRSAGINLNEYLTGAKGLDDIFIELAEKWDSLDQVQQRYIATMAAGSRQQSRFIALMSDYKRTVELVNAANNANGASQEQYSKTLESLQTKLARLKNAWNEFILGLTNSDAIKEAVDALTNLLTAINNLIKAVSGKNNGVKMVTTFLTAFTTFRIGSKLTGNTVFGKFFKGLITDANGQAVTGARNIASTFYDNLATQMSGLSRQKLKDSAISKMTNLKNYFAPVTDDMFNTFKDQANGFELVGGGELSAEGLATIEKQFKSGTASVEEMNATLRSLNVNYQITEQDALKFGVAMKDGNAIISNNVNTMRQCSTAALALGGALMGVGTWVESLGDNMKPFGTMLKYLGGGLLAFGTIMSVTLPLQARLGAQQISGAIYSIPIIGWLSLIVSLVVAVGVAIHDILKDNTAEAQLQKSAEAAKEAAEAADEAKEAYEKLGEAWDDLNDKYEAIEKATKGTQEWRDAIKQTNDAVLELANSYDGVKIERDENGILRVTNQKEIDDREKGKAVDASVASRIAQINKLRAAQRNDLEELKGVFSSDDVMIGDFVRDGIVGKYGGSSIKEIQTDISKRYGYNLSEEEAKGLQSYGQKYGTNEELIKSQEAAIGAEIMNKAGLSKETQKYVDSLLSSEYIDKKVNQKLEDINTNVSSADVRRKYAEAHNTTYEELKAQNNGQDLDEKHMRAYLAGMDVVKESIDQVKTFTNNLENLAPAQKALFAGADGSALTKDQYDELAKIVDNEQEIIKIYKDLGGDAVYGKDGQAAFIEWFKSSVSNAGKQFDISTYSLGFKDTLDKELADSLNAGTYRKFVDNLWSIYSVSGNDAMKKVQDSITKMAERVSPDMRDAFMKEINNIDWSSAEALRNLDDLADEFGVPERAIKNFRQQIFELGNVTAQIDFTKLSSLLVLAKNISNGKQGRSFEEEDYKNAVASGVSEKNFQYNIETGKYDYIGKNVSDVTNAILGNLDLSIKDLEKKAAAKSAATEAEKVSGNVDVTNTGSLAKFLGAYIQSAGDKSLISREVLSGNLKQMQDAYYKIMDAAGSDAEVDLRKAKEQRYQVNNGMGNASIAWRGGEDGELARNALISQVVNSGLPEEIVNKLLEGINTGRKDKTEEAGGVVDVINEANQYGIDIKTLNEYADAIRQINGLENAQIDEVYALALANTKYQEGLKKIIESHDDWAKLKNKDGSITAPEDGNLEQLKTFEQLKKDLKETFGLADDVSGKFLESADNVKLLEKAAQGDKKAISQVRAEAAKINVGDNLEVEGAKDQINSLIDNMAKEAPELKFGASLDDSEYATKLLQMMKDSGATADQINKTFESLGWTPPISYKEVPYETLAQNVENGAVDIVDPVTGKITKVTTENVSQFQDAGVIKIPEFGNAKFVKPTMPSTKPKAKKKGGGGSNKNKKKTYWENPYDELYNLQQKINEALRTRESLERRYQKLLKQEQATLEDIRKSYYAQITNLRSEANLQKQFAEGRLRQISNLGNKIYTDENGKRKTFKSLGVTKYASYNADTGLLTIDWEGLEAISKNSKRTNEGKAAEAYISKLEELVSSYEEVRDKLWDIEDEIENLRETAIESYLSFEDRVMESLVTKYQQQIDSYQAMSDALDKANNEVINSLREQVELSRQIRDNTEKENEISDMENRLAYLQRDTSGANALEVQKLQKDLEDAREGYTDTLIDQAIDKIQKDADVAAEQRARQIETMTEQLEIMKNTGALWQQVYDLIDEAGDGNGALSSQSNLVELLKKSEAFASLSNIGQEKWWSEVAEQFHAAWVGRGESEDKYKRDANNDGIVNNTDTQDTIDSVAQTATTVQPTAATTVNHTDKDKYGVALAVSEGSYGWGVGETRTKNLKAKGFNPDEIQAIINKVANDVMAGTWSGKYYGIKDLSPYKLSKFKQGGLADFTGPAWLDGTKTRPELILNAQDSRNFITLKDILASLMNSSSANGGIINEAKQVNVDIQATIQGDYDVDRMVERVKKDIYDDGQYRNVNAISFLR